MTGTLGLFSLVDLFQLLSSSSRTGRLVIDHPNGVARVYFDKGRVVHAEFGPQQGDEAVYALFGDERGSFEFSLGLPAPRVTVNTATDNLLLEAIRRLDESQRDAPKKQTVSDEAVPAFPDDAPDAGHLTFHAHEVTVFRFIDGERDLRQLAHATALSVDEVRKVVSRLVRVGALVIKGRKPRVARLVAQLAKAPLPSSTAGIDSGILDNWEQALGHPVKRIVCKRPNGKLDQYMVKRVDAAGPYILFSRETLFASDLAANTALLVKPAQESVLS